MGAEHFLLVSPVDGSVRDERAAASLADLDRIMLTAAAAQRDWQAVPLGDRLTIIRRTAAWLVDAADEIAIELAWQMGRPVRFGANEVRTAEARAHYMLAAAADALSPELVAPDRCIAHEPVGIVLVIAPWNYPFLTAINAIVPALAAGNAVVLKHSFQTPLVADRFAAAFAAAGLPPGVFQTLHSADAVTRAAVRRREVGHVVFTGSVAVGRLLGAEAARRLKPVTLELGGKDAAYVRRDADVSAAATALAEGTYFNSGQSCCAVERIYVDAAIHDTFVEAFAAAARTFALGNPLEETTTLGPMARPPGAAAVREQIAAARSAGAVGLLGGDHDGQYVAAEALIAVDHSMAVMRDESFGPVVGIMPAADDHAAIASINDSSYGLTASVWTADRDAASRIAPLLDVGTVYHNRCDSLDPALPWSGRRDSGTGLSLSHHAYRTMTHTKSLFGIAPAAGRINIENRENPAACRGNGSSQIEKGKQDEAYSDFA